MPRQQHEFAAIPQQRFYQVKSLLALLQKRGLHDAGFLQGFGPFFCSVAAPSDARTRVVARVALVVYLRRQHHAAYGDAESRAAIRAQ